MDLSRFTVTQNTTVGINNFTSPYYTGGYTRGINGRYSTISVVYTPATVPTPWPLLAANLGYALISSLWAIFSVGSAKISKWPIGLVFSVYNTFRCVWSLVVLCVAVDLARREQDLSSSSGAHFLPVSQLAISILGLLPYIFTSPKPWNKLAVVDTVILFVCLTMSTFTPYVNEGRMPRYGSLTVLGGNCPVYVDSCQWLGQDWQQYPGCGWFINATDATGYHFDGTTILARVEPILGILFFAPLILAGGIPMLLIATYILSETASAAWEFVNWFRDPHWTKDEKLSSRKRGWLVAFAAAQILIILTVGIVVLQLHRVQEGSYENSYVSKYAFVDSFGPPRNLSTQTADESWVDCFTVLSPGDKMGFWSVWWEQCKQRPFTCLGLE